MIEFMIALPWLALLISALYEDCTHRHNKEVTHARNTAAASIVLMVIVLFVYLVVKSA